VACYSPLNAAWQLFGSTSLATPDSSQDLREPEIPVGFSGQNNNLTQVFHHHSYLLTTYLWLQKAG